jgi:hypothetical protein
MNTAETNSRAYAQGYSDGWKSVVGSGLVPQIPSFIPAYAIPAGKTHYEAGYESGRDAAAEK